MAYLRKENETVEIDYSLTRVWAAVPKALASLEWTIEETDDTIYHIKSKTKGGFMSYPSVLKIDGVALDEKTARVKVTAETPVTTITSIADFGRTRDRIERFFEALSQNRPTADLEVAEYLRFAAPYPLVFFSKIILNLKYSAPFPGRFKKHLQEIVKFG